MRYFQGQDLKGLRLVCDSRSLVQVLKGTSGGGKTPNSEVEVDFKVMGIQSEVLY